MQRKLPLGLASVIVLGVVAISLFSLKAATAQAPLSLTTNSFADSIDVRTGDGLCADDVGLCTLRAAVMEGNASATGAVIELPAGDYVRTIDGVGGAEVGGLNITGDITIMGGGQHATVIDAASMDRVFVVTAGASLTLSDLTIQHGLALVAGTGGGVLAISGPTTLNMSNVSVRDNDSGAIGGGITIGFGVTAVLEEVEIVGNHAPSIGGGILTVGSLTMRDSVIANNTANNGGGLWNGTSGTLTMHGGAIVSNNVGESGGGVWNSGDMTLTDVSVSDNIAAGNGGGIQNIGGAVTLTDVSLFNNTATAGRGGGISTESRALTGARADASVNIIGGSVVSNTAGQSGGAIFNFGGALLLTNVELWNNHAAGDSGGAIDNSSRLEGGGRFVASLDMIGGSVAGNTTSLDGGGINNFGGTVSLTGVGVTNNTARAGGGLSSGNGVINAELFLATVTIDGGSVSGNTATTFGGGILNGSTLSITNSTISGNTASAGAGGGIHQFDGGRGATLTVVYATFSDNAAATFGGGIANSGGTVSLTGTIVANNLAPQAAPQAGDCAGSITSLGHNLDSDGTCNLSEASDISNADPKLQHLKNNGGPTETHMLLPGSPALDAIATGDCAVVSDQRGEDRPRGDGCDIGAVERGAPPVVQTVGGASEVAG